MPAARHKTRVSKQNTTLFCIIFISQVALVANTFSILSFLPTIHERASKPISGIISVPSLFLLKLKIP